MIKIFNIIKINLSSYHILTKNHPEMIPVEVNNVELIASEIDNTQFNNKYLLEVENKDQNQIIPLTTTSFKYEFGSNPTTQDDAFTKLSSLKKLQQNVK